MWKPPSQRRLFVLSVTLTFCLVLSLSDSSSSRRIESEDAPEEKISNALRKSLDYLSRNYRKINVDCLYGVVIAGALLQDAARCSARSRPYGGLKGNDLEDFELKIDKIYHQSLPFMENYPNWAFTKYMVDRNLWLNKQITYKPRKNFKNPETKRNLVYDLFNDQSYVNFTNVSDHCLSSLIKETSNLRPKVCRLESVCAENFLGDLSKGPGYIKTHKLLFLQTAKLRSCLVPSKMFEQATELICKNIYKEILSVERFSSLDKIFDLFLEQCLLCGLEGFSDFLQPKWLEYILSVQHKDGCFPVGNDRKRPKRDFHLWQDGCSDHTTGLGTAVLSLYLNYVVKSEHYCVK